MKRFLAGLTALTTVLCAFSACGKDALGEGESHSETTAAVEEATETTEGFETSEAVSENLSAADSSYEGVIKEFIQAYLDYDCEKTLKMQYPDGIMDAVDVMMKADEYKEMTKEEIIREMQEEIYDNYDEGEKAYLKSIVSAEPLTGMEEADIKDNYGIAQWIVDYINEKGGPDKVSIEEIEEAADEVDEDELMEKIVITEGYYVTMEIEDGEGETSQGDIIVYRINDGGWKVLVPYGSDIRRNYAQEQVKSLFKACNSALCDMDEEDLLNYDAKPFIVSSDDSMNYNVPNDFDVEVFKQKTKNYMSIITGIEWFAVLQDGVVIYTVIMNPNTEVNSVTFPHESIIYKDTEQENLKTQSVEDPKSYDELYEICKSVISNY